MYGNSRNSKMFRMILAGLLIFLISASGCVRYPSPSGTATLPAGTYDEMPARTEDVTTAATLFPSPLSTDTPAGAPAQRTGSLVISSSPPASSVYIDGMYAGDTPTVQGSLEKGVKTGPHTVRITKTGYDEYHENVYIFGDESLVVTATLPEKPFPYYTLNRASTFTESLS
jgi:hypothetical protein